MQLRFAAILYPFYIKSEVQLIYVQMNANDRHTQAAMLQHRLIRLDDPRSRQDGVGESKSPRSVHDYSQTDGYNVGTMTN